MHQPDRSPGPDNRHAFTGLYLQQILPVHHASQRLDDSRLAVAEMVWQHKRILPYQPPRDANVFGKSTQVHQQVIAQIGLSPLAEITLVARGRITRHHPHPHLKLLHVLPHGYHVAGKLVAKEGGRIILGVSPFVRFDIGATRQGGLDLNQNIFCPHVGHRHLSKGEFARGHKNRRPHMLITHPLRSPHRTWPDTPRSAGTYRTPSAGKLARSVPAPVCPQCHDIECCHFWPETPA